MDLRESDDNISVNRVFMTCGLCVVATSTTYSQLTPLVVGGFGTSVQSKNCTGVHSRPRGKDTYYTPYLHAERVVYAAVICGARVQHIVLAGYCRRKMRSSACDALVVKVVLVAAWLSGIFSAPYVTVAASETVEVWLHELTLGVSFKPTLLNRLQT
eukprot:6743779-Pyramimonas_sp.AAC.2